MEALRMNTSTKTDLEDIALMMESLAKQLPKLTLATKVDMAARLRGVAKAVKAIDDSIKDEIKAKRNGRVGVVAGDLFKAVLSLIPTTRLDQKKLEIEQPKIYAKYLKTDNQTRITFEVR
jgi:predicted phage-related endonuclease